MIKATLLVCSCVAQNTRMLCEELCDCLFDAPQITRDYSFLDYILGGCQLMFTVSLPQFPF